MIMTKAATAEAPDMLAPMQEGMERLRQTSEKLSATYAEIAAHQLQFLQKTVFDGLLEFQGLSRVRNPAEFFELGSEFAWQQAERSLKAFGELGNEVCGCWFAALKSAPAAKETKSRAAQ
jgi:hypothetical protein